MLHLNKENLDNLEASFLDLEIKIENGKFIVGLFDKTDNFLFSIVIIPHKSSDLPAIIFYYIIDNNTNSLIFRRIKQNAHNDKLLNVYLKKKQKDIRFTSKIKLKMFKSLCLKYFNNFAKKYFFMFISMINWYQNTDKL